MDAGGTIMWAEILDERERERERTCSDRSEEMYSMGRSCAQHRNTSTLMLMGHWDQVNVFVVVLFIQIQRLVCPIRMILHSDPT